MLVDKSATAPVPVSFSTLTNKPKEMWKQIMLPNPGSGVSLAPRLLRGSAIAEPDSVYKLHGARYQ